jgi:hypothetical protein
VPQQPSTACNDYADLRDYLSKNLSLDIDQEDRESEYATRTKNIITLKLEDKVISKIDFDME